jgi:hypothetical protein
VKRSYTIMVGSIAQPCRVEGEGNLIRNCTRVPCVETRAVSQRIWLGSRTDVQAVNATNCCPITTRWRRPGMRRDLEAKLYDMSG